MSRFARAMGVALVCGLALALWLWTQGSEGRAIRELPAVERTVLFEQTSRSLATLCGGSLDPRLREHCRQQAEFLQEFPECDARCLERTRAVLLDPPR